MILLHPYDLSENMVTYTIHPTQTHQTTNTFNISSIPLSMRMQDKYGPQYSQVCGCMTKMRMCDEYEV